MKIGIDGNEMIHGERAIRRYAVNLIQALASESTTSTDEFIAFYFRFRKPAYPVPQFPNLSRMRNRLIYLPGGVVKWLWNEWGIPPLGAFLGGIDLFHSLGEILPPRGRLPLVVTIHSVAHLRIPGHLDPSYVRYYEAFMKKALRNADYFICVSESMKQDFMAHYGVGANKIKVTPLGIGNEFYPRDIQQARAYLKKRFSFERPYVLYAGGIQRNKNIQGILEAFSLLKKKKGYSDLMLVLAGGMPAYARDLAQLIPDMNLTGDVFMTGWLDQESEDLPMLYSAARTFFFPSFWEGWSSPPLEAMASGIPVIASDIPPHQENLGHDVRLVDPHDSQKMAEALDEVLSRDSETAERFKLQGLCRARRYTWHQMAQLTLDFYHHIGSVKEHA
ncbi:MAG: glycosyltransferase family 1 protein [Candidatus Omnitrophica bacterium]|nr:glycosyltransferase family 1 protein [Candidatus Omnitrophota bacterium]